MNGQLNRFAFKTYLTHASHLDFFKPVAVAYYYLYWEDGLSTLIVP
jgi:hypothetical protein